VVRFPDAVELQQLGVARGQLVVAGMLALVYKIGMRKSKPREFSVVVERDAEGFYVASVPELRGCHTQARSLDKLMRRVREAIELCLEVEDVDRMATEFVGVQRVRV
jgi:predicted RNase H-like HicB family nuclease